MPSSRHRRAPERKRSVASSIIGVLGELLITVGAFLLLFVVWQLWWTDVIADREHAVIIQELQSKWGGPAPKKIAPPEKGEPPKIENVKENEVWGELHVPKFDKATSPMAEGVSMEKVLNVIGNGHYPDTALPGEVGNFAFAGHRSTYGRPLHDIARLQPGDPVIVEGPKAYYVYYVTGSEIVQPNDVQVIAPVPNKPGEEPTERMLTMTACHPMYSAAERYITYAKYDHWVDRSKGIPKELAEVKK